MVSRHCSHRSDNNQLHDWFFLFFFFLLSSSLKLFLFFLRRRKIKMGKKKSGRILHLPIRFVKFTLSDSHLLNTGQKMEKGELRQSNNSNKNQLAYNAELSMYTCYYNRKQYPLATVLNEMHVIIIIAAQFRANPSMYTFVYSS